VNSYSKTYAKFESIQICTFQEQPGTPEGSKVYEYTRLEEQPCFFLARQQFSSPNEYSLVEFGHCRLCAEEEQSASHKNI
jgi:hypothetical protein